MAKKYDDFDEADQDGIFDQIFGIISQRKREFAIVSVVAAVVLLGIVVFGSYPDDADSAASDSVPIVRADAGAYKTTPDNPGGMEIPYRDSTVFSSADAAKTDGGTENILADEGSEEPLPRDQLFAGLNTENNSAPVTEEVAPAPTTTTAEANPALNPILGDAPAKVEAVEPPSNDALVKEALGTTAPVAAVPEAVKPAPVEPAPVAKIEPKEEVVAKTEPAAGTAAAKVTPGGYYVQLASVKSTAGAASEYKKMQVKYSALSGVKYRTQEANLGAKGTFYRIQAGPMSKESASSVCGSIKAKGGSCLVTAK
ncbi:MAG: hypothetical protein DI551_10610 [Micavibrio aeruginosavorus]|uniref:SPOR domain-containing protein n=1 Tax=Micavibrio aeruginosavorus TaxID=349221 RepID=A0A2W5MSN0_9BACT|nr:MAG: hypothetical protein DI551_10610 [Micavibrio aeruginosavorus]